ncbi:MAG: peptidylprolyl isomerase [Candidatus Limnocylindria bacterium]
MSRVRGAVALLFLPALVSCSAAPTASLSSTDCPSAAPTAAAATGILADAKAAVLVTSLGTFTIELDASSAPIGTANFVALARCGFYAGITFHRVLAGFVAQAGDPQTRSQRGPFEGLGSGGPGYQFQVEFPTASQPYDRYTVAMANSMQYDATGKITGGTDTNGSQFFIDLASLTGQLRPYYSVIGKVTDGSEVVDAIGQVAVNNPDDGVPVDPVIIESITVKSGP